MCGRLPSPLFPFLLFPSFLIMPFFYLCHPPLYFSCVRSTNAGLDNSISVFNTIMPQFRGSVNHQPHPPHPPNPYLAHGYRHQTHIMHCPQLSSPPPLIVAFACLQRDSWIFEPILNLWPAGLKKRTVGSVCVCVCTRPGVTDGGGTERVWMDNIQKKCARHLRDSQILSASSVRQHHWAQKMKRKFAERPPIHKVGQP